MDFAGYEIFVTKQTLPHLETTWTPIEVTASNTTFKFKRVANQSKVFTISGYIQKSTMYLTRVEAEGLNTALCTTPSGIFTDGNGETYECLVDDWSIEPEAGVNRYTFSMTLRTQ